MFFLSKRNEIDAILMQYFSKEYSAESDIIHGMMQALNDFHQQHVAEITALSERFVAIEREEKNIFDTLIHHYDLDSPEGYALICLAEALLRIPDISTKNELIADKLQDLNIQGDKSSAWQIRVTDQAIKIASGLLRKKPKKNWLNQVSEPIIRGSMTKFMKLLGNHYIAGRTIDQAINQSKKHQDFLYSFDMLGEAARTEEQALQYLEEYKLAANQVGSSQPRDQKIFDKDGISVKLSALSPNYEVTKYDEVISHLLPRLAQIAEICQEHNIPMIIDAEEARRLDISLIIFKHLLQDERFAAFNGIGLAIQAYNKKILDLIDSLVGIAQSSGRIIPVRLVKGAYWDYEIKYAQQHGHPYYPVFTHKHHTDIAYVTAAKRLIQHADCLYPQFATHNDCTVAYILTLLKDKNIDFEFQKLHGMGNVLYEKVLQDYSVKCRIYAPVGRHRELLPYLIRRLVENGANSSFIKQLSDEQMPIEQLQLSLTKEEVQENSSKIACPIDIFGKDRTNSIGYDLGAIYELQLVKDQIRSHLEQDYQASTISSYEVTSSLTPVKLVTPHDTEQVIGHVIETPVEVMPEIIQEAVSFFPQWRDKSVYDRALIIRNAANILSSRMGEAAYLLMQESGKTIHNAIAEIREAIDFMRYYAKDALQIMPDDGTTLPSITGEHDQYYVQGKGVFACISPWNFPLAIFTGQITAALLTGNVVIAKPSEYSNLVADWMVKLLHEAGIPKGALHLVIGTGKGVGNALIADPHITGVCFTGSTETAMHINRSLAAREAPPATLIAETGGMNAMIMDSTAFIEQAVDDIVMSAFDSAGQRCSALRVLYVQKDVFEPVIEMLIGRTKALTIGNPMRFHTDIGPVISQKAKVGLEEHILQMEQEAELLYRYNLTDGVDQQGYFVAPHIFKIDQLSQLKREVFGPILHVISYDYEEQEAILNDINQSGYGLTFGIHSRIQEKTDSIIKQINAGNIYVNQAMIGATVGSQPFGGHGKSGTGPKAGGPHYLYRFVNEKTVSINTTSIGGNIELLSELSEDAASDKDA